MYKKLEHLTQKLPQIFLTFQCTYTVQDVGTRYWRFFRAACLTCLTAPLDKALLLYLASCSIDIVSIMTVTCFISMSLDYGRVRIKFSNFNIGELLKNLPIANINSSPINHLVR